jgi:hypothetical protein
MGLEEGLDHVAIMCWFYKITIGDVPASFSGMSRSSSMIMLCKMMQDLIICQSTFGFQYSAWSLIMPNLFCTPKAH